MRYAVTRATDNDQVVENGGVPPIAALLISNLAGCVVDVDELHYRAHISSNRLDREGKHVCQPLLSMRR